MEMDSMSYPVLRLLKGVLLNTFAKYGVQINKSAVQQEGVNQKGEFVKLYRKLRGHPQYVHYSKEVTLSEIELI